MCQCGWDPKHATFQEYFLAPGDLVIKLCRCPTFDEATTIPLVLATAVVPMWSKSEMGHAGMPSPWEDGSDKFKGQPALITGGSTSVGPMGMFPTA
ncbi:uncharacterized protein BXZ73DRAFT_98949 [Epithele typhae]|uniref:uncharacterized protein n=1 Tax=Epithele typhae TaxID=378194 RepID=UPI0020080E40|nr:uncharacterized protein BXZ73DRAFT_98949 [Epithele typhae]KAH9940520.1 hypothetical protein BXZ73DRAFT_98949 [Epithele typhae]